MHDNRPETRESINFYRQFAEDLLSFKILSWISDRGTACRVDSAAFKFYAQIGILTALNIKKIDAQKLSDDNVTNHFTDALIKSLILKIDVLLGLYNSEGIAEMQAYKKLHKFQLLINIEEAI